MERIRKGFNEREIIFIFVIIILFIAIRLPGAHLPLHQDEYKWPMIVNPANQEVGSIPHPPLSQFIYRTAGYIVGFNTNFRYVPLFFGTVNLFLLYYLMSFVFGRKQAVIASLIWAFSYFSVLASLMVDTDGEIMPFFFLLALIGYFKLKESTEKKYFWWGVLVVSCVLGFLVKVSFLLATAAIFADYLWSKRNNLSKNDYLKYVGYALSGLIGLGLLLIITKFIFPFFNLSGSLKYWEHFWVKDRNWFQTAIQCVKALMYASPLLVIFPFFLTKEEIRKTKVFLFFIIFAFIFYVLLFDFSIGALDRYLQLLVLPLAVMSSVVIQTAFDGEHKRKKEFLLLGTIASVFLILLQSLPHFVPPLHPKTEWIERFMHLKWNFLFPFTGGSGPLGFYVSFLFIALTWLVFVFVFAVYKFKPQYKKLAIFFLIPLGIAYNGVFIEEYLIGYWNGSAPYLLRGAVEYIKNNPDIKMVTVYNDNGGNEIREIGKYRKRLYVDPKFDINEKIASLNTYKEHYLVIDIPRIDPTSVYQKYFDSCKMVYEKKNKSMSVTVYDCRNAPSIKM